MKDDKNKCIVLYDKSEFHSIDIMKFVCSLLVVAIHIPVLGNSGQCAFWFDYLISKFIARLAVPLFFSSSGFFLFKKAGLKNPDISIVVRYIKRLVTLYLIWSIIYFPFVLKDLLKQYETNVLTLLYVYFNESFIKGLGTHLWYLPALVISIIMILVFGRIFNTKGMFVIAFSLYFIGLFGDGWYGFLNLLEIEAPGIMKIVNTGLGIIGTTRNGFFEGYFFVLLGAICANYPLKLTKAKVRLFFLVSILGMALESCLLFMSGICTSYNMCFFMAPTVLFLFILITGTEVKKHHIIYSRFRFASSVIFFIHILVEIIMLKTFSLLGIELNGTAFDYPITVFCCFLVTIVLLKFSSKYSWIKKFF